LKRVVYAVFAVFRDLPEPPVSGVGFRCRMGSARFFHALTPFECE